jgi:hypothetical protein
MSRLRVIALALATLSTVPAAAQPTRLPVGLRIRVTAPSVLPAPAVGNVVRADPDSLVLTLHDGTVTRALAAAQISELAVSGGRPKRTRVLVGAGVGFLGGMVLGGYLVGKDDPGGFGALAGMMAGMIVGPPIGGLVGAATATEKWDVRPGGYNVPATPSVRPPSEVEAAFSARPSAEPPLQLALGSEVRVRDVAGAQGSRWRDGRVERNTPDSLILARKGTAHAHAWRNLGELQVRAGEDRRRGFTRGALIAAVLTAAVAAPDIGKDDFTRDAYAGTIITNGLLGGLLGGAVFAPKGWQRIPIGSVTTR